MSVIQFMQITFCLEVDTQSLYVSNFLHIGAFSFLFYFLSIERKIREFMKRLEEFKATLRQKSKVHVGKNLQKGNV